MSSSERNPPLAEEAMLRILVVEDTPEFRQLIVDPLEREGFDVKMAEDGERAIELARSLRPDLIVLDLGLPKVDAVEAFRQIRTFSDAWIIMDGAEHKGRRNRVGQDPRHPFRGGTGKRGGDRAEPPPG